MRSAVDRLKAAVFRAFGRRPAPPAPAAPAAAPPAAWLNGWVGWSLDDWALVFDLLAAWRRRDRAHIVRVFRGPDGEQAVVSLLMVLNVAFKQDCRLLGVDPDEHLTERQLALAVNMAVEGVDDLEQ